MKAQVLLNIKEPLSFMEVPEPKPGPQEVLLKVESCGVCRTDLHILDGELAKPKLPLILGHQIVGRVIEDGSKFKKGERLGAPWLQGTCGQCQFCKSGRENLCDYPIFTGYSKDGGYAEFCTANEDFCFKLPDAEEAISLSPLLCPGLIGYRSYKMLDPRSEALGFYGFGASAHILIQLAVSQGKRVFVFTRKGDKEGQNFALTLGAFWVGGSDEMAPEKLDGIIIFAPSGALVPIALKNLQKGGNLILAGIHMSPIPSIDYDDLWNEKMIKSVANLTRQDGKDFLEIAPGIPIKTITHPFPLKEANQALQALKDGTLKGSIVLIP